MNYIDTYYARTLYDNKERARLEGTIETDCCIVGGGLAGLNAALYLARAGKDVVVLEANQIGWGASGRNGGFVSPGYSHSRDAIARMVGEPAADALHRLSIEGMELVRDHIKCLNLTREASPEPGIMSVMRHESGDALRRRAELSHEKYHYPLSFMETEEVRSVLRSTRYFQAVRDDQAFHFHPLNYLRGLAGHLETSGVTIFEQSAATGLQKAGAGYQVQTPSGVVRARDVIITTGGYTDGLLPRLRRAYLPIATYVLLTKPDPDLVRSVIRTRHGVGDNRRAGDYYRVVDGGRRILWGGRITTRSASLKGLEQELRAEMTGVYPELAALETETAWSGMMSYARHRMPQIGKLESNLWYCTAFGGHGMNTTAIGGKVVAEAVLGHDEHLKLFAPFGLDWAGGSVGLAAAQAIFWKLQLQDRWQEARPA